MRAIRLVHPFPSILDGLATAAIGMAAGGPPGTAVRLGIAMMLIQFAIGATNDILDAPSDAGRPDKPLAAGVVGARTARAVAGACAAGGLLLAALSGPAALALAAAGLGIGLAYDVRLKRTPWAWVAFASGIPLLVVFAWYGATGSVDAVLGILVPAAGLAGPALALGNELVDPDQDRARGLVTPAVALGPRRAWLAALAFQAAAVLIASASAALLGAGPVAVIASLVAGALSLGGLALLRDARAARRERGWELQAVGTALLGAAWVAGVALR